MMMNNELCVQGNVYLRLHNNDNDSNGIVLDEDVSWELRWVLITKGAIVWYNSEADVVSEGFVRIIGKAQPTGRTLENGESILTVDCEYKSNRVNVSVEIGVPVCVVNTWQQVIDYNWIADDRMWESFRDALEAEQCDINELCKSSFSQLVLHIKGEAFSVPVFSNDDIDVATEKVLLDHKLKPEMRPKMETELLRTKIDACHFLEAKLRNKLSQMERRLTALITTEKVATMTDDHNAKLNVYINAMETLVPQLQTVAATAQAKLIEKAQRVEELADQLALEKLDNRAVHESALQLSAQLVDKDNQIAALHKQVKQLEIKLEACSSVDLDPHQLNDGLTPTEREKKFLAELKELRHQKVQLTKSLSTAEEQARMLSHELISLRGKKAAKRRAGDFTEELSDNSDDEDPQILREKIFRLENRVKSLKTALTATEEANGTLKLQVDSSNEGLQQALAALKRCEDSLAAAQAELAERNAIAAADHVQSVMVENKRLREQCVEMRGEVVRLQANIEDVKSSAVQAIQELQMMGPEVNVGNLMASLENPYVAEVMTYSQRSVPVDPYEAVLNDADGDESFVVDQPVVAERYQPPSTRKTKASGTKHSVTASHTPSATGAITTNSVPNAISDSSNDALANAVQMLATAPISAVVQERLLRSIFNRYLADNVTVMNLTRFGRFSKEFGIVASSGQKFTSPPFIVSGEVDIVFLNCVKIISDLDPDKPAPAGKPFVVPKTRIGTVGKAAGAKQVLTASAGSTNIGPVQALTPYQFAIAVEQLACRVYADLIEQQTGTSLDCLPPKQREAASRAALEVLIKKKILPIASKLDLIPWSLIYVDEMLTSLQEPGDLSASTLEEHLPLLISWFKHYAGLTNKKPSGPRDGGYSYDEFDFKDFGISYKFITKFAHDFGIIPYLLKESSFFQLFEEIIIWTSTRREITWNSLPAGIRDVPLVALGDLSDGFADSPTRGSDGRGLRSTMGLAGFIMLIATSATQAFPDLFPGERILRIFSWLHQSGGSVLIDREASFGSDY